MLETSLRRLLRLTMASALLLVWGLATLVGAAPLAQDGLVFVVATGSGSSATFTVADSGDASVQRLWERVHSDPKVLEATQIYLRIQEEKVDAVRRELMADGNLSSADQAILDDLPEPQPVYVEVRPGTGGAYNDWKARFTLTHPGGQRETVSAPRIVFQANDPVAIGPDRGLFAQTLVHEIAHGYHAQLVGQGRTPTTPWLSRPHAGNTTSDGTLSLIEGYAEYIAAYITGRETIAQDPHGALTRNLYAYDSEGNPKDADDLWATEGWAATVMLRYAKEVAGGFDQINAAIRDENPDDFQELVGDLQERHPSNAGALKGIIRETSNGAIYADTGTTYDPPGTFDDAGDEGKGGGVGRILAMVVGGVLGATIGLPFGPIGILAGAALGGGAGALIASLFGSSDDSAGSFDWRAWSPFHRGSSKDPYAGGLPYYSPGAPGADDPGAAQDFLDQAYRRYLGSLSDPDLHPKELEAARQAYEAAQAAYRTALSSAR